jgi:hypothetical protein
MLAVKECYGGCWLGKERAEGPKRDGGDKAAVPLMYLSLHPILGIPLSPRAINPRARLLDWPDP